LSIGDPLARLVVMLVGAAVVGLLVRVIRWRAGRAPVRHLPHDVGPFPAALYFGDAICASCIPAAAAIEAGDLSVRVFEWASAGDVFDLLEIAEVPRLIVAGKGGRIMADITGVPSSRQIARAKLQLSQE